jgi:di/tricarboxylate transporter
LPPRDVELWKAIFHISDNYYCPSVRIYGPGNYRFFDFIKVGSILTILIYGIAVLMVPWLWPI